MKPRLIAETLGTAVLLAIVVGSGIMGAELADGNTALALLANAWATGLGLAVLIAVLGPVSGAHFNPAVSLTFWLRGELSRREFAAYVGVQCLGAVLGVWLAHAMFDLELLQLGDQLRSSQGLWLSETVATAGLILVILAGLKAQAALVPWLVGAYIASAYWFTASTSFANPAVTLARGLTATFSGIAPSAIGAFIIMQILGALLGLGLFRALYPETRSADSPGPAAGRDASQATTDQSMEQSI